MFNVEMRIKCAEEPPRIDFYRVNTVSIFRTIPVGTSKFCFHTRVSHPPPHPPLSLSPFRDIKEKHPVACFEYYSNKGNASVTLEMSTKRKEREKGRGGGGGETKRGGKKRKKKKGSESGPVRG